MSEILDVIRMYVSDLVSPTYYEVLLQEAAREIERLEADNRKLRDALNNRAGKLLCKGKYFLCVTIDEPYFSHVYDLIRKHERHHGRWTDEDEQAYRQRMNQWAKGNQAESEVSDE